MFRPFEWNVHCQVCGDKMKSSEATIRWDGLIVGYDHPGCFETRHPLDLPRPPVRDEQPIPFTIKEPEVTGCTNNTSVAGLAVAGCAKAGTGTVSTFNSETL